MGRADGGVGQLTQQPAAHRALLEPWEGTAGRLAGWLGQERIHVLWGKVGDATPHTRMRWREPLMAAVAPDHEYAKPAVPIAIRDLPQVPFVHLAKRELDALGRASSKPPRPSRSETPSEEGANGLTARRNGPTFTASARTLST